jgi:diaminohydroxyphosphoribosylaminopyrimidine deaminase/5-amino-6-(5-phosphoribosylamino)uracil reductase
MTSAPDHESWMRRALALAERGRGLTSPNPMVGAVVVRDGTVVGEGFHERAGGPHAEVTALAAAAERARGATLYVTLEPCMHQGQTPPCAPAVVAAGIRTVVAAVSDPNPFVAGGGADALRAAGVDVRLGVLADRARTQNRVFFTAMRERRPHVTLKAAMTLDGKIADAHGVSRWITGEAARPKPTSYAAKSTPSWSVTPPWSTTIPRSRCGARRHGRASRCASCWIRRPGHRRRRE